MVVAKDLLSQSVKSQPTRKYIEETALKMDRQEEYDVRVQRGRERGIGLVNKLRENARLQAIKWTKILEEREEEEAKRADFERKVNFEFNKQAKYICIWLRRATKRSIFCRTVTNSWTKICNRKIAGLKILIFWRSWVINRHMKKKMNETMSMEMWINGLNRWILKKGSSTEEMR